MEKITRLRLRLATEVEFAVTAVLRRLLDKETDKSAIAIQNEMDGRFQLKRNAASVRVLREQCPHRKIDLPVCGATPDPPSGARTFHPGRPIVGRAFQRWARSRQARPPRPWGSIRVTHSAPRRATHHFGLSEIVRGVQSLTQKYSSFRNTVFMI